MSSPVESLCVGEICVAGGAFREGAPASGLSIAMKSSVLPFLGGCGSRPGDGLVRAALAVLWFPSGGRRSPRLPALVGVSGVGVPVPVGVPSDAKLTREVGGTAEGGLFHVFGHGGFVVG